MGWSRSGCTNHGRLTVSKVAPRRETDVTFAEDAPRCASDIETERLRRLSDKLFAVPSQVIG